MCIRDRSCQEEALTAIERSIAHERTLRSRIVEAEQHGHQIEISVASELTDLRDTRVELSERAILDNAAIRDPVSYTHLRAHETPEHLVCRLLLEKKKIIITSQNDKYIILDNQYVEIYRLNLK
eukprot:TRINITY_DN21577_c0_g1_i1.p1 TRINITY_DN21577_c0_g1~~TRINITY_DN21577_c0_g1_i1.p1  ORF type:complete len:124 (-),score=14.44 TRINITY_DN21577_c0_g1_i1:4-375(-)